MEIWKNICTWTFIISIGFFAGMSVWVIIGGWQDLMEMFRQLKHDQSASRIPDIKKEP